MVLEDRLYPLLKLYNATPQSVKTLLGSAYRSLPPRIRLGANYESYYKLAETDGRWGVEKIHKYKLEQINTVLANAKQAIPFYRLNDAYPTRIDALDDLGDLPLITKELVREKLGQFMSNQFRSKDLISFATSGSTGQPLSFRYEKGVVRTKEAAYINSLWHRIGYSPGDKLAQFRSLYVKGRDSGKIWEYEAIKNRWIFSSFDVTSKNAPMILAHLRRVKPDFLYVYPSVLTILANYMLANDERPLAGLKGILSGSENTFPYQLNLFEKVFACPTHRWYGLSELSALGGSCEKSNDYHCFNSYSHVELLNEEGAPVVNVGERGEIVGTSFDNLAMPLIRYRTGDFGIYGGRSCSKCGRNGLMISEIEGRSQETIYDKHEQSHSLGPYLFGIHEEIWSEISGIQFHQREFGVIEVKVTSSSSRNDIEDLVIRMLGPRFYGNFSLNVEVVSELKKTRLGKHKYLVQELEIN